MINDDENYLGEINVNGMILAAGAGTRLRPLTDDMPKALAKIYGQTLLDIVCNKMAQANVNNIAANSHYCAEKIFEWLQTKKELPFDIKLFPEAPTALGTGGPLINAKEQLCKDNADYFILHNCDIISNINLQQLVAAHHQNVQNDSNVMVTMCLVDGTEPRIVVDENSRYIVNMRDALNVEENDCHKRYSYAGISCFSTKIFEHLPQDVNEYCIIELLLDLMKNNLITISSFIADGETYWNDIGSSSCFYDVHKHLLENENFEEDLLGCKIKNKETYWSACQQVLFLDNSDQFEKMQLKLSNKQRAIVLRDEETDKFFVVDYNHSLIAKILQKMLNTEKIVKFSANLLKEQGSSRYFYRLNFVNNENFSQNKVLMLSSENDVDFDRFINYATIYRSYDINVPEIFGVDRENYAVLMEDFGDFSLHDFYLINSADDQKIVNCYKKIIDELIIFQKQSELVAEKLDSLRIFDYDYLRWETNYFLEYFLNIYCKEDLVKCRYALENVFTKLADLCLNGSKQCLIHRDFQSMNIHLLNGCSENNYNFGIIDFQGGRLGSQFYDLASLINDPYVNLNPVMRNNLYLYYCEKMQIDSKESLKLYLAASLQRTMQALGAYAFLSLVKNKKDYRQYIVPGLRLLIENCQRICFIDDSFKVLLQKIINL